MAQRRLTTTAQNKNKDMDRTKTKLKTVKRRSDKDMKRGKEKMTRTHNDCQGGNESVESTVVGRLSELTGNQ